MCLATVYIDDGVRQEEVMRDVAWIRPHRDGLELITLIGDSRLFQAKIQSVDLMHGSIVLETMTAPAQIEAP